MTDGWWRDGDTYRRAWGNGEAYTCSYKEPDFHWGWCVVFGRYEFRGTATQLNRSMQQADDVISLLDDCFDAIRAKERATP